MKTRKCDLCPAKRELDFNEDTGELDKACDIFGDYCDMVQHKCSIAELKKELNRRRKAFQQAINDYINATQFIECVIELKGLRNDKE